MQYREFSDVNASWRHTKEEPLTKEIKERRKKNQIINFPKNKNTIREQVLLHYTKQQLQCQPGHRNCQAKAQKDLLAICEKFFRSKKTTYSTNMTGWLITLVKDQAVVVVCCSLILSEDGQLEK